MSFAELVERTAARNGITKKLARDVIRTFVAEVSVAAARAPTKVPQLGVFLPTRRKSRRIAHPQRKGETIQLPETQTVIFRASYWLRHLAKEWAQAEGSRRASEPQCTCPPFFQALGWRNHPLCPIHTEANRVRSLAKRMEPEAP